MKKRLLSGMRPTGPLHLGHLVGALEAWVELQEKYDCLFMVADWHALMSEYESPFKIKEYALQYVADWISCGLDHKKSVIFCQSDVSQHLELAFVLSVITPLSWLQRCPTYKEQLRQIKQKDLATYGFLGYPLLQAADILVYKAEIVPVGEDQLPHLEVCREIARRFNHLYKREFFPEPQPELTATPKLMGLDNRKMSKSYENFIALADTPQVIRQKVSNMFTDPKRIRLKMPGHPSGCNVYAYYRIFAPQDQTQVRLNCKRAKMGCTECKGNLADRLTQHPRLSEIRKKREELIKDREELLRILKKGYKKAQGIALETLQEVKRLIGL